MEVESRQQEFQGFSMDFIFATIKFLMKFSGMKINDKNLSTTTLGWMAKFRITRSLMILDSSGPVITHMWSSDQTGVVLIHLGVVLKTL